MSLKHQNLSSSCLYRFSVKNALMPFGMFSHLTPKFSHGLFKKSSTIKTRISALVKFTHSVLKNLQVSINKIRHLWSHLMHAIYSKRVVISWTNGNLSWLEHSYMRTSSHLMVFCMEQIGVQFDQIKKEIKFVAKVVYSYFRTKKDAATIYLQVKNHSCQSSIWKSRLMYWFWMTYGKRIPSAFCQSWLLLADFSSRSVTLMSITVRLVFAAFLKRSFDFNYSDLNS